MIRNRKSKIENLKWKDSTERVGAGGSSNPMTEKLKMKSEFRSSKQIQMTEIRKILNDRQHGDLM